jgi:hypothetical protein
MTGPRKELLAALSLALAALGARVGFVAAFPTRHVSDFLTALVFAKAFARDGFATGFGGWQYLNPGLPLGLSLVLRVVPGDAAEIARYSTAAVTGLSALCPFVLWRGVVGFRARVAASSLLALWPGHVVWSGVTSQDNWLLLPLIALASLATRVLIGGRPGWPVASALLWAAGGLVRQEMLVVSAPLALAGAGVFGASSRCGRALGRGALAAMLVLLAGAGLRWAGSGRFSLTTEHLGLAVLGAYGPGAASAYWSFPRAAGAALAPELVHNRRALQERALELGVREALRRPGHHAVRVFSAIVNCQSRSDSNGLQWALGTDVLPDSHRSRAAALLTWMPRAEYATIALFGAYIGVVVLAMWRRAWPLLLIAGVVLFKAVIHGLVVAQPRYFVPATALVLLSCGLATDPSGRRPTRRQWTTALALGVIAAVGLRTAGQRAEAYLLRHVEQPLYRFELLATSVAAKLSCVVRKGILVDVTERDATIRTLHIDPDPGEAAVAECRAISLQGTQPLVFEFDDSYGPGSLPGRILVSVHVQGREVLTHDLAAVSGSGSHQVSLGLSPPGASTSVELRVKAESPDHGWAWGIASATRFRLARAKELHSGGGGSDLAVRPPQHPDSSPAVGAWHP